MRLGLRVSFVCPFILVGILLAPAAASAQTATTFGIQGGVNFANVDFKPGADDEGFNPDFKSRTRAVFGGFVAFDFNPSAGLQIDALYSQKGAKTEFTVDDGTRIDFKVKLDYIEIPVLFRGNMRASDTTTVRLFGGPAFGFKVSDEIKIEANGQEEEDDETEFKSTDVGLVLGGAVQFGQVFVDLRYTWGLTNVVKDDPDGGDVKNRTFGIMVGIAFK